MSSSTNDSLMITHYWHYDKMDLIIKGRLWDCEFTLEIPMYDIVNQDALVGCETMIQQAIKISLKELLKSEELTKEQSEIVKNYLNDSCVEGFTDVLSGF